MTDTNIITIIFASGTFLKFDTDLEIVVKTGSDYQEEDPEGEVFIAVPENQIKYFKPKAA